MFEPAARSTLATTGVSHPLRTVIKPAILLRMRLEGTMVTSSVTCKVETKGTVIDED